MVISYVPVCAYTSTMYLSVYMLLLLLLLLLLLFYLVTTMTRYVQKAKPVGVQPNYKKITLTKNKQQINKNTYLATTKYNRDLGAYVYHRL